MKKWERKYSGSNLNFSPDSPGKMDMEQEKNRNIKLVLGYDGTDFCGWQIQRQERTVQGVLEEALLTIHGHPVRTQAAGRTDTGVHATGQVVTFTTSNTTIGDSQFREALNFYLPHDVKVFQSCRVPEGFSARFSARARVYRYFLYSGPVNVPHYSRYAVRVQRTPNLARLNRYASFLTGEKDFTTFSASGDMSKSKVRIIRAASFYIQGDHIVFMIAADSFLYRMVRSIVGTILYCDENEMEPRAFQDIILARKRMRAGPTAPARGLFLDKVVYDE